jgi:hypothetical protein
VGKFDEANRLFQEILTKYPTAIDHHGDRLRVMVKEEMPQSAASTKPAA